MAFIGIDLGTTNSLAAHIDAAGRIQVIHNAEGSTLGGVHFELSGDHVTECVGGAAGIEEEDLHRAYKSEVDPRLNYEQALEMAMLVAHKLSA